MSEEETSLPLRLPGSGPGFVRDRYLSHVMFTGAAFAAGMTVADAGAGELGAQISIGVLTLLLGLTRAHGDVQVMRAWNTYLQRRSDIYEDHRIRQRELIDKMQAALGRRKER
jgi:hypothetical protein